MSVNKAIIIGRLTKDPECRQTQNGNDVCQLSLATNETWTDKSGEKKEHTEYHRVVVWSKLAMICRDHLKKGRQVYVEGRLQTRESADKSGAKRYTTEIEAQTVRFLSDRGSGDAESAQENMFGE